MTRRLLSPPFRPCGLVHSHKGKRTDHIYTWLVAKIWSHFSRNACCVHFSLVLTRILPNPQKLTRYGSHVNTRDVSYTQVLNAFTRRLLPGKNPSQMFFFQLWQQWFDRNKQKSWVLGMSSNSHHVHHRYWPLVQTKEWWLCFLSEHRVNMLSWFGEAKSSDALWYPEAIYIRGKEMGWEQAPPHETDDNHMLSSLHCTHNRLLYV